jgi:UDP:flavonoid glycosyltransferase YjiC (YdhE family)
LPIFDPFHGTRSLNSDRSAQAGQTQRDAVNAVGGDASYRSRVAEMQKAAREAGGYLRAADAVQQFGYQHSVGKKKE